MKKNKILNKTDLKEAEKYFEETINLIKYIKLRNEEEAKNLLLTAINTIKNAIKLNPYEKKYSEKLIFLKNELQKIEKDNIPIENKLSRIEIAKKNGNMLNEKNLPPIKSKIITEESNFAEKYINKALILDENNKKCISLLNQIDIISKNIANKYNENGFSLLNSLNDENIVNSKDVFLQIKNYCENSILFDIQNIQYKKKFRVYK